jgi:hypothetical protein
VATLLFYNILCILAFTFALLYEYVKERFVSVLGYVFSFLSLWIPSAIRYGVGTDYMGYYYSFFQHDIMDIDTEPAFYFINWIVLKLGLGVQWIFVLSSFITYIFAYASFPKKKFSLCVLFFTFYMYLASYSLVRQGMAISIIMYGISQLIKGRHIQFIILVCIASLFHYSALIMIPTYLFSNLKFGTKSLLLLLSVGVFIIIKFDIVDQLMNNSLLLTSKYGVYATYREYAEPPKGGGTGIGVMIRLFLPVMILFFTSKVKQIMSNNYIIIISCLTYICAYLCALQMHIFNRLVDAFMFAPIFGILLFVQLINYDKYNIKYIKVCLLFFILIINFMNFNQAILRNTNKGNGGLGINPYSSIFNK